MKNHRSQCLVGELETVINSIAMVLRSSQAHKGQNTFERTNLLVMRRHLKQLRVKFTFIYYKGKSADILHKKGVFILNLLMIHLKQKGEILKY